jgi:hypothetical protein
MEIYRGHEITCGAKRATLGKPSAKWCCSLSIRQVDQALPTYYEVSVTTWTVDSARILGLCLAREHIDRVLGVVLVA